MTTNALLAKLTARGKFYDITYNCEFHGLVTEQLKLKDYGVTTGGNVWTLFDTGKRTSDGLLLTHIKDIDIVDVNRI